MGSKFAADIFRLLQIIFRLGICDHSSYIDTMAKYHYNEYVQNLSPKRQTKTGSVFCTLELQTDSDECTPFKVFGEGGLQLSPRLFGE